MPELPEVETMARDLTSMRGCSVLGVDILDASLVLPRHEQDIRRAIIGHQIVDVTRRAKWLQWLFEDDGVLLFHPRMTGRPELVENETAMTPHIRARFTLDDGRELRLRDPRRFGRLALGQRDEEGIVRNDSGAPFFAAYGPEPLTDAFTPALLKERLRGGRPLKSALLDQAVVSGLGNIYVDEALHRARLHPLRRADSLTLEESKLLHAAIVAVLSEGIAHRGAAVSDYQAPGGGASMQRQLRVYRRAGQPCGNCQTPITRLVVGGRGTHLCPSCQPEVAS